VGIQSGWAEKFGWEGFFATAEFANTMQAATEVRMFVDCRAITISSQVGSDLAVEMTGRCRADGAEIRLGFWCYKYAAPSAVTERGAGVPPPVRGEHAPGTVLKPAAGDGDATERELSQLAACRHSLRCENFQAPRSVHALRFGTNRAPTETRTWTGRAGGATFRPDGPENLAGKNPCGGGGFCNGAEFF
jgi:hypothetical protein